MPSELMLSNLPSANPRKINAMQKLGAPYPEGYAQLARGDLETQAMAISENLKQANVECESNKEIIAMIAYLQVLGTAVKTR